MTFRFGGIAQELTDLLYNQDMGDNSTMWNLVMQSNMLSLYVSYHFLKFANLQLEYINSKYDIISNICKSLGGLGDVGRLIVLLFSSPEPKAHKVSL